MARLALVAAFWVPAQAGLLISEFLAGNQGSLLDEDHERSDWIELYNSGSVTVDLEGWTLTDDATEPRKWRFPKLALPPNEYLVVFASGKNRRLPESPLHTNFRLSQDGEHLALIDPDGQTTPTPWTDSYPVQIPGVSFGLPISRSTADWVGAGTELRWAPAPRDLIDEGWTALEWEDSSWTLATNGIGRAGSVGPQRATTILADSAADFSSTQGARGWFYGLYDASRDQDRSYSDAEFAPFPTEPGPVGAENVWTGNTWEALIGRAEVALGETFTRPAGRNSGREVWPIRRWISSVNGAITVEWGLAKQNRFGSGVSLRLYHNGRPVSGMTVEGNDLTGSTRTQLLTGLAQGDRIDWALSPHGADGTSDDIGDGANVRLLIRSERSFADGIRSDLGEPLDPNQPAVFVRIPFSISERDRFTGLTLRLKYKESFAAYLDGVRIAGAGPSASAEEATEGERSIAEAINFEEFRLPRAVDLLQPGRNLLGLWVTPPPPKEISLLLDVELRGERVQVGHGRGRYFAHPTPGAANGGGESTLGPLIIETQHSPARPSKDDDLIVLAQLAPTVHPVREVHLNYRVHYGPTVSSPMFDDGRHEDGLAEDNLFGGRIPAEAFGPGQMVRYFVSSLDSSGASSRSPPFPDPINSPEYHGTVVADPSVASNLPVLEWFLERPSGADSKQGTRCSLYFLDQFYDNVHVYVHGQSSLQFPKKSYNLNLNTGHKFRFDPDQGRVSKFNLLTTYPDKAHMRNILAYETLRNSGAPAHIAFPLRVQRNGEFFGDWHFVEDGDEDFLERVGLDPRGALYKGYNRLDSATSGVEKKTRRHENHRDLQDLLAGLRRVGAARTAFLYDAIDLAATVNFLAGLIITGDIDCCHKNYYLYRDTEGNGEWQFLPWDVDLTFGRNWTGSKTYYDDTMYFQNPLWIGSNNNLIAALFATPGFKEMYLRRIRTLMDELIQPPGTPPEELRLERRIRQLSELIEPDSNLDFARWPTWGEPQTFATAVNILTNFYLPRRRIHLFQTLHEGRRAQIPDAQSATAQLVIGHVESVTTSGNPDEEYLRLDNPGSEAVDISGWTLRGAVEHRFDPGTVVPAGLSLYVSPNVVTFRARTAPPRGGQGLFVQGDYQGRLSAWGETVQLWNADGRVVASLSYPPDLSPAQRSLRVTEIMYHPSEFRANSPDESELTEYLELRNVGSEEIDLAGVRFTDGIQFEFAADSPFALAPGEAVLLVRNRTAFVARYGEDSALAGEFSGRLDNAGETLRLEDARGEVILEFRYDDSWHRSTDGQGAALVIDDGRLPPEAWDDPANWHPHPDLEPLENWRARFFSAAELLDPSMSGNSADPDGDSMVNEAEYRAGTHPREGQSLLHLRLRRLSPGYVLEFEAVSNRSYTVQYRDDLQQGAWRPFQSVEAQDGDRAIRLDVPLLDRSRFYRIITPGSPN